MWKKKISQRQVKVFFSIKWKNEQVKDDMNILLKIQIYNDNEVETKKKINIKSIVAACYLRKRGCLKKGRR